MTLGKKLAAMLALSGCLALLGAGTVSAAEEGIRQGVFINGEDVSGMGYSEAEAVVENKLLEMLDSTITVEVGEDTIEATAVDLGIQWKNRSIVKDALNLGNAGNLIKRYKDTKDLEQEPKMLKLNFKANDAAVRNFVEEKCMQFEKEPRDASISADGYGGFDLMEGVTGQTINVEESVKALEDFVANQWESTSKTVALSVVTEEPKGNTKDLEVIQDLLGTYTTYYGSTYGRNTNVERGAALINDHVIYPGESFSVCSALVPFTPENGYELGGAYENGRVVQEYGGGICQVSTTLYNALLLAEVEIVERSNHTMSVNYVPPSMDAAIAEGSMDLVFRNDRDTPIFISGYAAGGELTFSVWGQETRPEDRYVSYEGQTLSTIGAPTSVTMISVPEQSVGYFSQVQAASGGSTAALYKYVTYNGETTTEQINSSTYQATGAIYEVGTLGASDALMSAIYSGDLAAAQLAAAGGTTPTTEAPTDQSETQQSETQQSETVQTETVATEPPVVEVPPETDPVIEVPVDPGTVEGDGVIVWQ